MSDKTDIITSFEQVEQTLSNTASLVSSYYKDLIKNGVPVDLAYKVVLDWHKDFWLQVIHRDRKDG